MKGVSNSQLRIWLPRVLFPRSRLSVSSKDFMEKVSGFDFVHGDIGVREDPVNVFTEGC